MADRDIAFAPVKNLREALDDPQLRARNMVVEDARGWEHVGNPLHFEDEPPSPTLALPDLGQHSLEILADLGYDQAALDALVAAGTVIAPR